MEQYVPPLRHWRWWLSMAVLAASAGMAAYVLFAHRIDERVADGTPVPAEVTAVKALPIAGKGYEPQRVTVTYDLDGRRTAKLGAALEEGSYRVGDRITLYADPADPGRVAAAGGFASEGRWLLVPPAVIFYGLFAGLAIAIRRGRWWWRHERSASTSVPLLTVTGSDEDQVGDMWDWVNEARGLRAAADEVSRGRSGTPRLLIFIRLGVVGEPRVAYYSKRSKRLVVVGCVQPGETNDRPGVVLREVIARSVRLAGQWTVAHPGTGDPSPLESAAIALATPPT